MVDAYSYPPDPRLGHCIEVYVILSSDTSARSPDEQTLLPHVTQSLVIGLDHAKTVYDCDRKEFCAVNFFSGPNIGICHLRFLSEMKKLIIHFKPGGLFKVFQLPAYSFFDSSHDAAEWLGNDICQLTESLHGVSNAKTIECTNRWLIEKMENRKKSNRCIDAAIDLIQKYKGNITMREVEEATYTTKRTLERHFLEQVGLHPKTFSRLIRFNHVIHFLQSNMNIKWRQVANSFGYYDQSHFIHEFKSLAGKLPRDYFLPKSAFEKLMQP